MNKSNMFRYIIQTATPSLSLSLSLTRILSSLSFADLRRGEETVTWIKSGQKCSSDEVAAASNVLGVLIVAVECVRGVVLGGVGVEARLMLFKSAALRPVAACPLHCIHQLIIPVLLVRYAVVLKLCIYTSITPNIRYRVKYG